MHESLLVDEIVHLVCNQLSVFSDRESLINLALAGRSFTDHALNMLWYELNTLEHLIDVMPADLWIAYTEEVTDEYIAAQMSLDDETLCYQLADLRRSIVPDDWTRFDYYAKRVKRWEPNFNNENNLFFTKESLSDIRESRGDRALLLPRLRHISFMMHGPYWEEIMPFLGDLLLGPSITSVFIEDGSGEMNAKYLRPLLETITKCCPFIQSVKATGNSEAPSNLEQHLSTFLSGLTKLQELGLEDISLSDAAVEHIALLPCFTTLQTSLNPYLAKAEADTLPFTTGGERFPMLDHLQVRSNHWKPVCTLLRQMQCPFRCLRITNQDFMGFFHRESSVVDMIQILCANPLLPSSLIHLSLTLPHFLKPEEASIETKATQSLRGLFAFASLQELHLHIAMLAQVSDAWLSSLPHHWPNLRVFEFSDHFPPKSRMPKPTLGGVALLAHRWHYLAEIGVTCVWDPFDPSALEALPTSKVTMIKQCASRFSRQASEVDASYLRDIATCLMRVFPDLVDIELGFFDDELRTSWETLRSIIRARA